MADHVITVHSAAGCGDSFGCACGLPLGDRDAAARHAARSGLCPACLGSGQAAPGQDTPGDCEICGGSGSAAARNITVQARVTEDFVRKVAALLPEEFGLGEVVALLRQHMPRSGGMETVLSVAAGMIRYLEVQGHVVLYSAPDFVPAEGIEQNYRDPRWIRITREPYGS
ncbi:hypothetical protein [Nonomuraea jiangxiensis]|uniref:Uncharacterized protein n=1 Tax=Nonomuraea jiangxiensis TaxID=633440 RepID=A0A1G9CC38_9ACTN|nr:hypothetical protein [Nonomuraea jiangxiensis]SDK49211.1 hypothetical protein SAMN05421869_116132 [Nonomuraea jiangxiensis]